MPADVERAGLVVLFHILTLSIIFALGSGRIRNVRNKVARIEYSAPRVSQARAL